MRAFWTSRGAFNSPTRVDTSHGMYANRVNGNVELLAPAPALKGAGAAWSGTAFWTCDKIPASTAYQILLYQ